jgi:hypothetical protein
MGQARRLSEKHILFSGSFCELHVGEIRGVGVHLGTHTPNPQLVQQRSEGLDLLMHRRFVFFFRIAHLALKPLNLGGHFDFGVGFRSQWILKQAPTNFAQQRGFFFDDGWQLAGSGHDVPNVLG